MIHVPKDRLAQVEYLLEQSSLGNHVLFDRETLLSVFARHDRESPVLSEEEAYACEPFIERLLEEPSIERKRAYLAGLEPPVFDRVVMTYFTILENNLYEKSETRH